MSEMVDRIANVMAANHGINWENSLKNVWRNKARAVIAAMREPTDRMVLVVEFDGGKNIWRDMIDAALQ